MVDKISIHSLLEALPYTGRGVDASIGGLEAILDTIQLDMSPAYQRSHVWTQEQQEAFAGHVLTGGKVPALIVREIGDQDAYELVDGKQRLTALLLWKKGEIGAQIGNRRIFIDDTDRKFRPMLTIRFDFVRCETTADVLRLYLRLNSGVAHSSEELARVRRMLAEEMAKG